MPLIQRYYIQDHSDPRPLVPSTRFLTTCLPLLMSHNLLRLAQYPLRLLVFLPRHILCVYHLSLKLLDLLLELCLLLQQDCVALFELVGVHFAHV